MTMENKEFDPFEKERQLKAESDQWDTTAPEDAIEGDIPVVDLSSYFDSGDDVSLSAVADQVRQACEETGFFTIVGHGITVERMQHMFEMVRRFHALPEADKKPLLMDRPEWPVGGVGYMPLKNRKLPTRDKGNLNEAFIVKYDDDVHMEHNQWPRESALPGFRQTVEEYAHQLVELGRRMLPVFATALEMPKDYFDKAFEVPTYRLRMTHYPAVEGKPEDEFGIAPHVDTTFCTILAQDSPGLTIFSERRRKWIKAPMLDNAFIVNSGELLRHWTNDRFISVKHFANNNVGEHSRYSIPFFLNANQYYKMSEISTCVSESNPMKYPAISYSESQAVAQGE
ncbi:MAG: 2-oxoglutarate and iron-dependent oxygenase domain-containing protein [Pseudomonadota bacterium]